MHWKHGGLRNTMSLYPIRPSFAAGVLAPALHKRTDLNQYYLGLRTGSNVIVLPQGGVVNRPGFEYIGTVKDSSKEVRVVPFEFSTTQAYVLEFGDYYMRVFKDGGQVVHTTSTTSAWATATGYVVADFVKNDDVIYRCISAHTSGATTEPGTGESWEDKWVADAAYEIATPWPESVLFDLRFQQSADTLYVFHPSYDTRTITRSAHTTWTLDTFDWENGPFMKDNTTDSHTLTVTSYGGSKGLYGQTVTVTSSADLFTSTDVGRWLKIGYYDEGEQIDVDSVNPSGAGDIPGGGPWNVDGNFEVLYSFGACIDQYVELRYSTNGGSTYKVLDTYPDHTSTTMITKEYELRSEDYNHVTPKIKFWVSGDSHQFRWAVRKLREARTAYLKITTYSNSKSVRAKVYRRMSQFSVPTNNWAIGAWGTTPGWPKTGGFGNGRLWLAGTPEEPQTIWGSKTQDYVDFSTSLPLVDDDAVNATLDSAKMNAIEHIVAMNDLIVMTSGSVWRVSGGSDEILTPMSIMARFQEGRGANKVQPIVIGNSILFCARKGNTIRELAYTYEKDVFTSLNRSILSQHYFDGYTIIDMAYQQEPWSVVWMVRDDGKLLSFTYLQEHEVFAWTEHTVAGTGAEVESVCVIPGTDEDEVWIVVKRTVNSATVRYIERLHTRDFGDDLEDAFFVDSGLTYDGAAATTLSGLSHLEGQTVAVLADGEYIGTKTVASGQITLTTAASVVQVGLPYDSVVETLGIEVQTNNGTIITRPKLVNTVWVSVYETQGIQVGPNSTRLKPLPDCANDLYTGDARILMDTGWEQNGRIYIKQSKPLPMEILAITPQLDAGRK